MNEVIAPANIGHRILRLMKLCNSAVVIEVNDHRTTGLNVKAHLNSLRGNDIVDYAMIPPDIEAGMVRADRMVRIRLGDGREVYHFDLDAALEIALHLVGEKNT